MVLERGAVKVDIMDTISPTAKTVMRAGRN
jgi:hypothetical protein